jgi:hypothetical protein
MEFAMAARNDWASLMRSENFERAWRVADEDLKSPKLPPKHQGPRHLQRIWRGEPLHGRRVLVRSYHGLGDTIQFCRFLAPLRQIAREVIVWCQPDLIPLVRTARGVDRILALHDGTPDIDYDVDIEIMELAHALRVDRRHIAGRFPYLSAAPATDVALRESRHEVSVGLIWQAGEWDSQRSIPAEVLQPLHDVPGISLYSLQRGAAQHSAPLIPAEDISTPDIAGLASLILQLDLLISVDSMPAHLAGALNKHVWTMLRAECDWRWPRDRATTVWYPTMRLFHQPRDGAWEHVVAEIADALARRASARLPTAAPDWARSRGTSLEP